MSSSPPDISVCLATWKPIEPPNIGSMVEGDLPTALGDLSGEVIVTLNGLSAAEAGLPSGVQAIRLEANCGIPIGWNRAAARAQGRVICFANDDLVLGPDSLSMLYEALSRSDAGVVGPVGTDWDVSEPRHIRWVDTASLPPGGVIECDVVSGFFFATPRAAFEEIGGFDEAYTPYGFEEVDYCTSVRRRLGLRCYGVGGVRYKHEWGLSAQSRWRRIEYMGRSERLGRIARRNREYFRRKWADGGS